VANYKEWIKTGARGARAEFSDADIFTTILLLTNGPMGRYRLQKELKLSESSTKSLLNYCKKKALVEIYSTRKGHILSRKGKQIAKRLNTIICDHGTFPVQIFKDNAHYFVFIAKKPFESKSENGKASFKPSWQLRDIAISYGAKAILFLKVLDPQHLNFPEEGLTLEKYYPMLETTILEKFQEALQCAAFLLVVSAPTSEQARKSAIISSLKFNENFYFKIASLLSG